MPRPNKNYLYPKGRLNQLASAAVGAYFGGGLGDGATTASMLDTPDADYLNELGDPSAPQPDLGRGVAPKAAVTSVSDIQQPNIGTRPGLGNIGTWLSAGRNITQYDHINSQLQNAAYQAQAREVLQQQAKEAALNQLTTGHQFKTEEETLGNELAIKKAMAEEAFKRGVLAEDFPTYVAPVGRSAQEGLLKKQTFENSLLDSPDYLTAMTKERYAKMEEPMVKNDLDRSVTKRNAFINVGPGDYAMNIDNPAMGTFNRQYQSQPSASPVGPVQMTPDGTIPMIVPRARPTPPASATINTPAPVSQQTAQPPMLNNAYDDYVNQFNTRNIVKPFPATEGINTPPPAIQQPSALGDILQQLIEQQQPGFNPNRRKMFPGRQF